MESACSVRPSLESLDAKMNEIISKLDKLLNLPKAETVIKKESEYKKSAGTMEWSVETYYSDSVIIKSSFDETFKNFLKSNGGKWVVGKKSWSFANISIGVVIKEIKRRFPDWTFTDNRTLVKEDDSDGNVSVDEN
jgi:hypothetical protein